MAFEAECQRVARACSCRRHARPSLMAHSSAPVRAYRGILETGSFSVSGLNREIRAGAQLQHRPSASGAHASCVAYDAKLQLGGLPAPPRAECAGVKSRPGDEHSEPTLDARAPRATEPRQIQKVVTYVLNEYTALFCGEVLDRLDATALNALHLLIF